MAINNSDFLLSSTFDPNPEDILNKSIHFDLKKASEKKILDRIIEKMPNNDKYYIEHRKRINTFRLRRDKREEEKDNLFQLICNLEKNIARSKNNTKIDQLKRSKAEAKQHYKDLSEENVEILIN